MIRLAGPDIERHATESGVSLRRLLIPLGAVAIASVGAVLIMQAMWNVRPNTLAFETAKTLLQVGVVSAAAAALSMLTFEYQQEQQRADKRREEERRREQSRQELLQAILARAAAAYTNVKRARRLLRGLGMIPDGEGPRVLASRYEEQVKSISDAQLEFENLANDVRTAKATSP